MLEEYKELFKSSADIIPNWTTTSKNELCRQYIANKGNKVLQEAYFGAIMCRYWNLISKYYYMSVNCASIDECYNWLVDSVSCCLNLASWEDPKSSIYKDPTGPDKVINRCMKCARLTYYQYINRKKRKDNFGLLSVEELKELFGNCIEEQLDPEAEADVSSIMIKEFVLEHFNNKDYFVSFLIDCIITSNVFDLTTKSETGALITFNLRKLVKIMNTLDEDYLEFFSQNYKLPYELVEKASNYVRNIPPANMRKKITQTLESLKHSELLLALSQ